MSYGLALFRTLLRALRIRFEQNGHYLHLTYSILLKSDGKSVSDRKLECDGKLESEGKRGSQHITTSYNSFNYVM